MHDLSIIEYCSVSRVLLFSFSTFIRSLCSVWSAPRTKRISIERRIRLVIISKVVYGFVESMGGSRRMREVNQIRRLSLVWNFCIYIVISVLHLVVAPSSDRQLQFWDIESCFICNVFIGGIFVGIRCNCWMITKHTLTVFNRHGSSPYLKLLLRGKSLFDIALRV